VGPEGVARSCAQNALKIDVAAAISVWLPGNVHTREAEEATADKPTWKLSQAHNQLEQSMAQGMHPPPEQP